MVQSHGHAATSLNRDLAGLVASIKTMGDNVAEQLAMLRSALAAPKPTHLEQIKAADKIINAQEEKIEAEIVELLSRHHPMLQDLRFVAYALKIAMILERMGDLSKNAMRRLTKLEEAIPEEMASGYEQMAVAAHHMITKAMLLMERFDPQAAASAVAEDDRIDALYKAIKKEVYARMEKRGAKVKQLNQLQFIARDLERSGDYAAEIARIFIFIHTGEKAKKS